MSKKLLFEDVKKAFEDRGYELLEENYKNNKQKLKYRCLKHLDKIHEIRYDSFSQGHGCPCCVGKAKPILEQIKLQFENKNYILITSVYKNNQTKLEYQCLKHPSHNLFITYNNFSRGYGCPYCGIDKKSGENCYCWQGGITEINKYLRKMIDDWKKQSLANNNYKCVLTGSKTNIHIHHLKPFNVLVKETLRELKLPVYQQIGDYTQDEIDLLVQIFRNKHTTKNGILLRDDVHYLFHLLYGDKCKRKDFDEFCIRWNNKEFIDLIDV